jgi:hypothetical protein
MPINREQGIIDPQRRTTQRRRRLDDSAQRRRAIKTTIEPALDHRKIQSAFVVKQRSCREDTESSDMRWGIWPLDLERAQVDERQALISAMHME